MPSDIDPDLVGRVKKAAAAAPDMDAAFLSEFVFTDVPIERITAILAGKYDPVPEAGPDTAGEGGASDAASRIADLIDEQNGILSDIALIDANIGLLVSQIQKPDAKTFNPGTWERFRKFFADYYKSYRDAVAR